MEQPWPQPESTLEPSNLPVTPIPQPENTIEVKPEDEGMGPGAADGEHS